MKTRGVPLTILLALLANELFDSFAQYCFKKSADAQGQFTIKSWDDGLTFLAGVLSNGHLWLGLAAVAVVFVSWLTVLSKVDLSVATPITSFSYVFVAGTAMVFLHERISTLRWVGIAFILVGVAVVSFTSEHEEKTP